MSTRAHYLVATPILAMLLVACASKHPPLPTVESVDLDRYQGTWYEIASIPVPEQEGCYGTTASYAVRGDGTVDVLNRCLKGAKAEPSIARGTAIPKEGTNNSQLEVNFFGPFGGDYYIVALDPDYEYAMVAVPDRDHLWILSRTPEMDDATYRRLAARAESLGFDTSRLARTYQPEQPSE